MQEANQFDRIARTFDPKTVIADSESEIALISLNLSEPMNFVQRFGCFQFLDDLQESFLQARLVTDRFEVFPEGLGIQDLHELIR